MKLVKLSIAVCLMSATAMAGVQGRITTKIDSQKAEIELRGVKAGDKVTLLEEVCEGPKVKLCRTEKVGVATVSKVIDSETSEIKVEGQQPLKDGLLIEKQ
ncbi:hypothetical protein ACLSU7_07895 [Bdellovibrio sp. HCB185ZH]|uniref:hypothetical protein n=1 Tax=Bdellovibrio sp. HCB185ZH TaxID=3394235 RepID=UPI0039A7598D